MNNEVEFLQYVVENLVEHKDDIQIERKEDEMWILLTLKVNEEDMKYVIWKAGNVVNSIRNLLKILGLKAQKRINLKVEW